MIVLIGLVTAAFFVFIAMALFDWRDH